MLVITRKNREALRIGHDIEVTVLKVRGNGVQLGIRAPANVAIRREELPEKVIHCSIDSGNNRTRPTRSVDARWAADRDLEERVKNFLGRLNPPALHDLQVKIHGGSAVVSGSVHSFYQKQLATSCCQRVAGVLNVLNKVRVLDSTETRADDACDPGPSTSIM